MSTVGNFSVDMNTEQILNTGVTGYGVLQMSYPIGMVVGGLATPTLEKRFGSKACLVFGILSAASFTFLFTSTRNLWLSAISLALMGLSVAVANVVFTTEMQRVVPSKMRGRFFATTQTLITLALPVGFALTGYVAARWGAVTVFAGIASCFLVGGGVSWMVPISRPPEEIVSDNL